ncbi:uncharacterized protein LOC124796253 [Schistocerca piceifrons]|uniref:uncharacterized protein LOC124796253 n=1 Tax=Schistocerca piceifrons TaxID=274613 RepID=UPI001F5E4BE5|nr:uncharacterized protein LOC124796253 [Schistocerca piceifrons]
MRTFLSVVVSAMLLAAPAKADEPDLTKAVKDLKDCMASENLDSLDGLKTNKEATTTEEKCFIGCMMKSVHGLNSDGEYDLDLLKEHINHCPELMKDQQKKAAAIEVAESCAGKVTGCSGYCECGIAAGDCLSEGMEAKGYETIYEWLAKVIVKADA